MKSSIHYIIILGSFLLSTLIVSSSIAMEKVNLGYSTKNIPLPSRSEYVKNFIEKTEHFLRRMRWKAYHFLNPTESTTKETYGFKSRNSPPRVNELIPFEDGMLNLIQNIQFKDVKCKFLNEMNSDIKNKIEKPSKVLIPADKTTNYYKMTPDSYDKFIKENVTKTYKKSSHSVANKLETQSASIAKQLKLDDRIEKLEKNEAFITLKDHKPAFNDHPTCRLINPSKSEIGVVSKHILDEINSAVISSTQINQWKNTASVLKWFNNLENKEKLSFICFDVCEFYPSINEKLLSKALDFASKYRPISRHERDIILHAKRSLLFSSDSTWEKKSSNDLFDVTMGSFDGAETCELVGCYLLSLLTDKYGQNIGLYRDDGLAAFNKTPKEIEKIKKELCKISPDVSWNKPFKAKVTEKYDEWMANGQHTFTAAGNMRTPPRREIVQWILEAWNDLDKDIIVNSFKSCALTLAVDGSEDELIHCLKPSQPCHSGPALLKAVQQQLQQTLENDPFQDITLSDVEDAAPMTTLLEDSDTEIEVD
ncbi:uncharacterized protein LOC122958534 [Acropora millepora]|uniref:uncharacterized protein LOC122958534 n=1 Tax=Acropora millepora TaxID=45264 RepID=UPI001CF3A3F5|nr:uncharacterized protein LOC122958534 [Acropora millepora]